MIIDKNSEKQLYLQLYEYIKGEIASGNFKSGDKLPSKRKLTDNLGISINTINTALFLLEEEGYIKAKERVGYFVEEFSDLYITEGTREYVGIVDEDSNHILYNFSPNAISYDNFPYYTFSKLFKETLQDEDPNLLMNPDSSGDDEFKRAIGKYLLESRALQVNPENIVISSGLEYLFQILFHIFSKDDIFALENPGYEILPPMIRSAGYEYKSIPVTEEGIDLVKLEESRANIAVITPSHQFPTGRIMPIKNRLDILNWAYSSESNYIIEDDYDSEFKYVGKTIEPLKSLDASDKVIYIGSFSKSVAPSMRISYMVLPTSLLQSLKQKAPFFICSVPRLNQIVMAKFLENGHFERHLNKMRRLYKKRREFAISELESYKGLADISGAEAGLHIVVDLKSKISDEVLIEEFSKNNIHINAMSKYYSSGKKSENKFLLGFGGMEDEDIREGIRLLMKLI